MTRYGRADRARALGLLRKWRTSGTDLAVRPGHAARLAHDEGWEAVFRPQGDGWVPLARVALATAHALNVQDRFSSTRPGTP